jgi:hypothetical protein
MHMPVIIIGAPRSGTNMLRDALCCLPGLGTWPCDEINTIWRYGNPRWPSDELPPELATDRVAGYIESRFARLARARRLQIVVEKTCANSLRVPYVNAVLPNARYLWIHRDPIDCVASALKRWRAPTDWAYTLRKARYVPLRDFPAYGLRFVRNRLHRLTSDQGAVAAWGPVFEGMSDQLASHSLMEVCALQWQACVGRAAAGLAELAPDKWTRVSYEEFVREPTAQLASLCRFLGLSFDQAALELAVRRVSAQSVGKGRREFCADDADRIRGLVAPAVAALQSTTGSRQA